MARVADMLQLEQDIYTQMALLSQRDSGIDRDFWLRDFNQVEMTLAGSPGSGRLKIPPGPYRDLGVTGS
jgi:hypothetical protein